mmetsp:Transcript_28299/g.67272  ORF Transcript_28299/g.67272 Transcript_28299/m.67272 type:complete len:229 (-) Transcript_28299:368-1054(-)
MAHHQRGGGRPLHGVHLRQPPAGEAGQLPQGRDPLQEPPHSACNGLQGAQGDAAREARQDRDRPRLARVRAKGQRPEVCAHPPHRKRHEPLLGQRPVHRVVQARDLHLEAPQPHEGGQVRGAGASGPGLGGAQLLLPGGAQLQVCPGLPRRRDHDGDAVRHLPGGHVPRHPVLLPARRPGLHHGDGAVEPVGREPGVPDPVLLQRGEEGRQGRLRREGSDVLDAGGQL